MPCTFLPPAFPNCCCRFTFLNCTLPWCAGLNFQFWNWLPPVKFTLLNLLYSTVLVWIAANSPCPQLEWYHTAGPTKSAAPNPNTGPTANQGGCQKKGT